MSTIAPPAEVAVWMRDGVPVRLVWNGLRYRVTDTPTPLREYIDAPGMTHPLEPLIGWRFQGTPDAGPSFVFDVRMRGARWELVAAYD